MRGIPRRLLTSSMEWRAPSSGAMEPSGSYGEAHVLAPVRCEGSRSRARGGYAGEYQVAADPACTVFADARLTSGDIPPVGALASVDGGPEFAVLSVETLLGWGGRPHHTEIGLG